MHTGDEANFALSLPFEWSIATTDKHVFILTPDQLAESKVVSEESKRSIEHDSNLASVTRKRCLDTDDITLLLDYFK